MTLKEHMDILNLTTDYHRNIIKREFKKIIKECCNVDEKDLEDYFGKLIEDFTGMVIELKMYEFFDIEDWITRKSYYDDKKDLKRDLAEVIKTYKCVRKKDLENAVEEIAEIILDLDNDDEF